MKGSRTASQSFNTLRAEIWKHRKLFREGIVVAFDPSCVSSSLPGYALMDKLKVQEYGVLSISRSGPLHLRLQRIHEDLITEFTPRVSVVAIEEVSATPLRTRAKAKKTGKTYMNPKNIHSLAQAVGTFKCSFPVKTPILNVSPLTWQSYQRKYGWPWKKSDSADAYMILLTVRQIYIELERAGGLK